MAENSARIAEEAYAAIHGESTTWRLITGSCAGKAFEHHVAIEPSAGQWHCLACGTTGDGAEVMALLMPLVFMATRLWEAFAVQPVILVPSDSPPGRSGQFGGYDLFRVQGIERPMVAIPGT